jgi:transaldolase / glucose-6-phosphate isomerase
MSTIAPPELVDRIWARDATVWTGGDEANWLGWLDEPMRMEERVEHLTEFGAAARSEFTHFVLLGMGGSSLGPKVLGETFCNPVPSEGAQAPVEGLGATLLGGTVFRRRPGEGAPWAKKREPTDEKESYAVEPSSPATVPLSVLDTTHPQTIRDFESYCDLAKTLFVVSSKSGTTIETRCQLQYFWERAGRPGDAFVAITDPGSELEALARECGFREVFRGEPTIGGRYSVLSVFGLVPAALIDVDLELLLARAQDMAAACRGETSPGLELGLRLGEGWRQGRDKVCIDKTRSDFGLWAEQLLAESTGKDGKGLIPAPDESPEGEDRQRGEVLLRDGYDLAYEFFRWEFATAVAGSILGINPFDQPNVQEAKDRTNALLESGRKPDLSPEGSVEELLGQSRPGDYVCIQAFADPHDVLAISRLVERVKAGTSCVVTVGYGPRYLHSTGQLHKGGPDTGLFLQVVDDGVDELEIPGASFGFRDLFWAQAAGDYEALKERGRRLARVRLEDV